MKRFSLMVVLALVVSGFAMMTHVTPVRASTCTPNWQTVQSKGISTLYYGVFIGLGSVSLQRDGCGDIQARVTNIDHAPTGSLTITNVATNTVIYSSTTMQGHGVVTGIYSPTFAGYGGVGISVTGSLTEAGIGTVTATTTTDYGN